MGESLLSISFSPEPHFRNQAKKRDMKRQFKDMQSRWGFGRRKYIEIWKERKKNGIGSLGWD